MALHAMWIATDSYNMLMSRHSLVYRRYTKECLQLQDADIASVKRFTGGQINMETFSFKISKVEDDALNKLANSWGCNRAEAARRAIKHAHKQSETVVALDINKVQLQEIVDSQKRTIELLIEMMKHRPLIARLNRLEEYTVQACLSAGVLAKQAGVFERAKDEYINWKQNKEEKNEH